MALLTDTFGIFTDDMLTSGFSGEYNLIHESDQSDNPQDMTLYVGSLGSAGLDTADRQIDASSNPGVDNITISVGDILPAWTVATAFTTNERVEPVTPNTYAYKCTTAGTSHASVEPTWPTTLGSTFVDGTVIWTCISKKHVTSEISLSLTEIGLDSATPGSSLSLGPTIVSSVANLVEVWIRVENSVNTIGNTATTPELALSINGIVETEV